MQGKMDCFGLTDRGRVREINEDQFLLADLSKSMLVHQTSLHLDDHTRLFGATQGRLLVVADGMGGHAAGERASALAVDTLARYVLGTMPWFLRLRTDCADDLEEDLKEALKRCQDRIEASAGPQEHGMGTTLTLAYLVWPHAYVVHVGDSRCYLMRQGRLEQVTHDHTMAQRLVEQGVLNAREAEGSRWSHALWNCLGGGTSDLRPEAYKAALHLGDTILLCSDGLNRGVSDDQIRTTLEKATSAEEACHQLVRAANEAGGQDNITVVIARFLQMARAEPAQLSAVEALPTAAEASPAMSPALAGSNLAVAGK
jgi:PPM family protein phosphatase